MPTFSNSTVPGSDHAIVGVADKGIGIHGTSTSSTGAGGVSTSGIGVHGVSETGPGVRGDAKNGVGVFGASETSHAIVGVADKGIGIHGTSTSSTGAGGVSTSGIGVHGVSETGPGVRGDAKNGVGVFGASETGHAGYFDGLVHVQGICRATVDFECENADCAEYFDVVDVAAAEPGTVMVLGDTGRLVACQSEYDTRVVGVVSGAGDLRPGVILNKRPSAEGGVPIALLGQVYCKVTTSNGPIEIGDLLTASSTPGHAMKASDQTRAFGAVLGKALRPSRSGAALIPILVTLQ
jgi:hypothetical protein